MPMMNISFLGNFVPAWSTETDVAEALEEVGCTVNRIQEGTPAREVPDLVKGADVFLWIKTPSLSAKSGSVGAQEAMLQRIKKQRVLTVAYHLDRYFDLGRESDIGTHPWWDSDYVFSADGGNQDRFRARGINHFWLPPALRAREARHGGTRAAFRRDIIFVGSYPNYHPEWPWRRELVQGLTRRYRGRFLKYPRNPARPVRGSDLNDLYASAKVVVGDSIFCDRAERYWSDRVVEVIGRGGVLVHPRVGGLDEHFTPFEHYVPFEACSLGSLFHVIDMLLKDREMQQKIRANGPAHVAAHHTYHHRVQELLSVIGAKV